MFGSKLRSWMENHIVRPRKKGNKNKNATSNNLPTANGTQNGHKGTGYAIYQSDTTTATTTGTGNSISSPARRSEVSPIQSHTTSRFGWQSPKQETAMSPKSDHFVYVHSVKAHTLSSTSAAAAKATIAGTATLNSSSSYSASMMMNSKRSSKTPSPSNMLRKSSLSCLQSQKEQHHRQENVNTSSSGKKSKSLQQNQQHQQQQLMQHQQQILQRGSNSSINQYTINHNNNVNNNSGGNSNINNTNNNINNNCNHNSHQHFNHRNVNNHSKCTNTNQNYSSSANQTKNAYNIITSSHSAKDEYSSNKHYSHCQMPPSSGSANGAIADPCYQNGSYSTDSKHLYQKHQQNYVDENKYGKILPTKRGSIESFNPSLGSYDNINCSSNNYSNTNDNNNVNNNIASSNYNGNNNNNNIPTIVTSSPAPSSSGSKSSGGVGNNIGGGPSTVYQHVHHVHHHNGNMSGQVQLRNGMNTGGYEPNHRNMMRTNRQNGNSVLGPPSNHPLAHVINSLSSPESAYSTGYSTDGTSPGATYTPPEYYINIRTGTHYFPKGVNTLAIEATRYKFGLNKIEEMSPQEPLPNNHRRTESFDLGQSKIPGFGIPDPAFFQAIQCQNTQSPIPHHNGIIIPQSYKGFESPSPRQRCRIRTNPWYSTTDTSSSGNSTFLNKKVEIDASSSSSGIKSSSDAGASDKNEKNEKSSDSETTSSSTEVEAIQRTYSPGTIRRRKASSNLSSGGGGVILAAPATSTPTSSTTMIEMPKSETIHLTSHSFTHQDSDEDATLNEMMGKFDESYVYEKETDILSDSDPTDCASDLDTGQDAGDECDTDDLLDIDFIDTGSIQEIVEKEVYKNTGSCSYFNYQLDRRASRLRRVRRQNEDIHASKRRKRLMKTRKKSVENNKERNSPVRKNRESRSLGGTPVCLRRNQSADSKKPHKISPLINRSNSLTFTEVHAIRGKFVAIAESEKALLKADLEADVKYKQLIHEAETILVSMKTNALRDTPFASPRRIHNPPPNKRVEMLRNYEADIKREVSKSSSAKPNSMDCPYEIQNSTSVVDGILINKRLELLRYETNSAPNSPKCSNRFSPRKTHVTNFINQNIAPSSPNSSTETAPSQKKNISESRSLSPSRAPKSPQLQLNGRNLKSPKSSPSSNRRRVRSQSPKIMLDSDTDSEDDISRKSSLFNSQHSQSSHHHHIRRNSVKKSSTEHENNGNKKTNNLNDTLSRKLRHENENLRKDDISNRNIIVSTEKLSLYDESDIKNRNIVDSKRPSLMSFSSIDMGNRTTMNGGYCPQSEPLKRKIYQGSSSFEKLKKSFDLESEIPKQAILEKINNLRKERQRSSNPDMNNSAQDLKRQTPENNVHSSNSSIAMKQQLILSTIEDLKRSLEDQSVELYGLNGATPE